MKAHICPLMEHKQAAGLGHDALCEGFPLRTLRQAGMFLLAAVVPALLVAAFHPGRPAWSEERAVVPEVPWSAVELWRGRVVLVDARNAVAFRHTHIPDAVSLSERRWKEQLPAFLKAREPQKRVVVYCDGLDPNAGQSLARRLRRELGISNVFVLEGGWRAWLDRVQKPRT